MIYVKKSSGDLEIFDREKLKKSLMNADASVVLANEIIAEIEKDLKEKIPTSFIYDKAFKILKSKSKKTAMKYSLRRSLLTLGPTGFPFEKFVAKIFEKKGYKTKTGIILKGKCVDHEMDVVAFNDKDLILAEVKFHNELSLKSDTKVALYVKARFDDLRSEKFKFEGKEYNNMQGIIITNTKFTDTAKQYAKCAGVGMISWDYPKKGNLYNLMEETGLHPITILNSLSKNQKEVLIQKGIINCKEVKNQKETLKSLGLDNNKIDKIFDEVDSVCN
jgi:hypothetical protein